MAHGGAGRKGKSTASGESRLKINKAEATVGKRPQVLNRSGRPKVTVLFPTPLAVSEIFHDERGEGISDGRSGRGEGREVGRLVARTEPGIPEEEDSLGHDKTRSDPTEGAGSTLGAVLGPEPKPHLGSLLFLVTLEHCPIPLRCIHVFGVP